MENEFLSSQEFASDWRERIEADTWDKGKPMYYLRDRQIVEEWKDGRMIIIDDIEKAWAYQNTTRNIDGHNILGELRKLNQEINTDEILQTNGEDK